jgi:hypothetical protein
MYTTVAAVPANNLALSYDGGVLAVGLNAAAYGDSVLEIWTNLNGGGQYVPTAVPIPPPGSTVAPATQGIVSINNDGTIIALGIWDDNNNIGAVYIYAFDGTNWNLQGSKITGLGEVGQGLFGNSVSLNGAGNLLAVGCPEEGANNEGAVYIYNLNVITAPVLVQKINGTITSGELGWNLNFSADGSTLAVGAPSVVSSNDPGCVYIYTKIQGIWTQQAFFTEAPDESDFGYKVSLSGDGNILAVSSIDILKMYYRTPGYVGQSAWSTGALVPLPYDLSDPNLVAGLLPSLSQDGNTLCFSDNFNSNNIGASWSYTQGPLGTWTQNGPGFRGSGMAGSNQGNIALSGDGKFAAVFSDAAEFWVFV